MYVKEQHKFDFEQHKEKEMKQMKCTSKNSKNLYGSSQKFLKILTLVSKREVSHSECR